MYCNLPQTGVFIERMSRETRLNIRITPEFQSELKQIAAYYGLTVSSYVHSTLVRKLREERESTPEAFISEPIRRAITEGLRLAIPESPPNGKIAGMITPGERTPTKADVRHMLERDAELLEDTSHKVKKLPHLGEIGEKDGKKKRKTG